MAKELFGAATLSTVLDRAKRFAFGEPSQLAADNILVGAAVDEIRGYYKLGSITSAYTSANQISLTELVIIEAVVIEVVSGTPTFKIGSTSGGAEYMNETEALTGYNYQSILLPLPPSGVFYPRITGAGTLKVTLILKTELF